MINKTPQEVLTTICKLRASIDHLGSAIDKSKKVMQKNTKISKSQLSRLDSYHEVVNKQKQLVNELEHIFINDKDGSDLSRVIKKINSLSLMIKEDAQSLLLEISGNPDQLIDDKKNLH